MELIEYDDVSRISRLKSDQRGPAELVACNSALQRSVAKKILLKPDLNLINTVSVNPASNTQTFKTQNSTTSITKLETTCSSKETDLKSQSNEHDTKPHLQNKIIKATTEKSSTPLYSTCSAQQKSHSQSSSIQVFGAHSNKINRARKNSEETLPVTSKKTGLVFRHLNCSTTDRPTRSKSMSDLTQIGEQQLKPSKGEVPKQIQNLEPTITTGHLFDT